jgi:hypothetical protein
MKVEFQLLFTVVLVVVYSVGASYSGSGNRAREVGAPPSLDSIENNTGSSTCMFSMTHDVTRSWLLFKRDPRKLLLALPTSEYPCYHKTPQCQALRRPQQIQNKRTQTSVRSPIKCSAPPIILPHPKLSDYSWRCTPPPRLVECFANSSFSRLHGES